MSEALYFDTLAIGQSWKSRGRTITETDIVIFAGMTGDYDPLHVDHEFARQAPFGKPIAHGLLGLGLVAGLGSNSPAIHTVAFLGIREWEFLLPIFVGDTVYAVNKIVAVNSSGRRRGRVTWRRQLVNQNSAVVQQGIFETLVERAPRGADRQVVAAPGSVPARRAPAARKKKRK